MGEVQTLFYKMHLERIRVMKYSEIFLDFCSKSHFASNFYFNVKKKKL